MLKNLIPLHPRFDSFEAVKPYLIYNNNTTNPTLCIPAFLTAPRQLGHMPPATCHLLTATCQLPPARKNPAVGRQFF